MEVAKRWFSKFSLKEKPKPSKKKEATSNGKEGLKPAANDEAPSNATKQKVAAAKQYIEKHYKEQMKSLQERRERYDSSHPSIILLVILQLSIFNNHFDLSLPLLT